MKRIEHHHAKKKGCKGTALKILLWAFIVVFILPIMLLLSLEKPILLAIVFLSLLAFLGWRLWLRLRKGKKLVSGILGKTLGKVIPEQEKVKILSLDNLQLNNTIDIPNPYAGIFISGGAGAGKSKSIIEPLIADAGRKGFTGVIYDFKFPELASYVTTAYDNSDIKPYFINFTDLSRSNRINPIAPELMINDSFAREFAYSILANLTPSMISKPDFWSDNAVSLLTSVFWYLKERHPEYCTLPHAMSMVLQPDDEALLRTLSKHSKCSDMIAPILTAYGKGADNQYAAVISSLQNPLAKINSNEIYYLLSASDFNLALNSPDSKGILCIGNDPTLSGTFSPVIGLILTSISKLLNRQGKEKSVFMLDEFPTVYVPNVEQLPATARSNKVATILACQDIAQMVDKYGNDKTDTILSNLGNQFYGRTTNPKTAQRVSQMFGKADKLMLSENKNYNASVIGGILKGSGRSYAYQERDLVKPQDVATLPTGSFYTILSEGKERQGLSSILMDKRFTKTEILPFSSVTQWDLDQAFEKVKKDVEYILR